MNLRSRLQATTQYYLRTHRTPRGIHPHSVWPRDMSLHARMTARNDHVTSQTMTVPSLSHVTRSCHMLH
ncbi:hypothetical protein LSAT2_007388 [Lamellibrachia satsuma]|nr:hypothetical protein LSAT2_007388 [Lamellibrachia satsuma]